MRQQPPNKHSTNSGHVTTYNERSEVPTVARRTAVICQSLKGAPSHGGVWRPRHWVSPQVRSTILRCRQRRRPVRHRRPRRRRYGVFFREGVQIAWEASGHVCSERLQPFLSEGVPLLQKHRDLVVDDATRTLLLAASVSTWSVPSRRCGAASPGGACPRPSQGHCCAGRSGPSSGTGRWRTSLVIWTFNLVSHSGEVAAGTFIYTVSTVDLCTAWTERVPVLDKAQAGVVSTLDRIRQQSGTEPPPL